MPDQYLLLNLLNKLRDVSNRPGVRQLKYLLRHVQALAHPTEFEQMQQLVATLPLGPVLAQQPRFLYKYLGSYSATSFSRPMRLAAIRHHYQQLAATVRPGFFAQLAQQPVVWQQAPPAGPYRITLSYPLRAHFEGELSLNFYCGAVLAQMVTGVIVPGHLVGAAAPHVLLLSQVQGTRQAEALRLATKQLHDTTPASLLVHAAYGLATALGLPYAVGVGTHEQLGRGRDCHFDYDGFWQQFRPVPLAGGFYLLDPQAPERPLEELKAKYRPRTLRKRELKRQVRQAVAAAFRAQFMASHWVPARAEPCLLA